MVVVVKLEPGDIFLGGYGARQMDLLVSSPHLYANDQPFLHQFDHRHHHSHGDLYGDYPNS